MSNATLADATLVFEYLFNFVFNDGGFSETKYCAFSKTASIPAQQQSENTRPRLLGFIFRRFAKAAFDAPWKTLCNIIYSKNVISVMQLLAQF